MSNQDKAAEVIRTWQQRHKNMMDSNPDWAAQNLAIDLHNAGLLAPDLPEPDRDTRDPKWQSEYREDYEYPAPSMWCMYSLFSVGAFPQDNDITVWDDGEPLPPFSIAEARKLAYALLAAAQHQEKA